ncbi:MAG: hypothetical protein JWM62_2906, partial [Frankiales bacterium]|nr:hypothetical protein [Frankiales bacterium]
RLPRPRVARPATPRGSPASFADRVTARRGMSLTGSVWRYGGPAACSPLPGARDVLVRQGLTSAHPCRFWAERSNLPGHSWPARLVADVRSRPMHLVHARAPGGTPCPSSSPDATAPSARSLAAGVTRVAGVWPELGVASAVDGRPGRSNGVGQANAPGQVAKQAPVVQAPPVEAAPVAAAPTPNADAPGQVKDAAPVVGPPTGTATEGTSTGAERGAVHRQPSVRSRPRRRWAWTVLSAEQVPLPSRLWVHGPRPLLR